MRNSNNKSVHANKAAVSITSTLYDRRALDCTEDKPLVNSLNHLTFLASSSGKVRQALSQDGGLERLVDILYECRNPQTEAQKCIYAWKWVLAFQSLVLVGTRGSEKMRRKVVQAGILPIIATILDNYLITLKMDWVTEFSSRCRTANSSQSQSQPYIYPSAFGTAQNTVQPGGNSHAGSGMFDTPLSGNGVGPASNSGNVGSYLANEPDNVNVDTDSDTAVNDGITDTQVNTVFRQVRNLLEEANQTIMEAQAEIGKQKCEKSNFLPRTRSSTQLEGEYGRIRSCLRFLQLLRRLSESERCKDASLNKSIAAEYADLVRDSTFECHLANCQDVCNLLKLDGSWTNELPFLEHYEEKLNQSVPREFESGVLVPKEDDVIWSLQLLAFVSKYTSLRYDMANNYIVKGLSLRSNNTPPPLEPESGLPQAEELVFNDCDYFHFVSDTPPEDPFALFPGFCNSSFGEAGSSSSTCSSINDGSAVYYEPGEIRGSHMKGDKWGDQKEDSNEITRGSNDNDNDDYNPDLLKSYDSIVGEQNQFLEAKKLEKLTMDAARYAHREFGRLRMKNRQVHKKLLATYSSRWDYETSWEELSTPAYESRCIDDEIMPIRRVNIFPLVEKFTVRHLYSRDINYWSSVIVRNYNRKDETKGGRRQCAYFGCRKWEQDPRQFAKCRRCKRAKYCSKECQSKAWAYHKYWCNAVGGGSGEGSSSSDHHHSHRLHQSSGHSPNSNSARLRDSTPGIPENSQSESSRSESEASSEVINAPRFPTGFFG